MFTLPLLAVLISIAVCPASAHCEEPAEDFVTALIQRQYYDIALEYLDRIVDSPLVSEKFRQIIPLEKAKILTASASKDRNPVTQAKRLDEADQLLAKFLSVATTEEQQFATFEYRANLMLLRGKVTLKRSANDRLTETDKESVLEEARKFLQQARSLFEREKTVLADIIKNFRVQSGDPTSIVAKQKYERKFISVRKQLPLITELLARTLPKDSDERKKLLTQAVAENEDVYNDYKSYRRQAFTFEALINGARAAQTLGDDKKALRLLDDIFILPNGTTENRLKKSALLIAVDSWNNTDPYPADEVFELLEAPINGLLDSEKREPDWQRLQLEFTKARLIIADRIADDGRDNAALAKFYRRESSKTVRTIARANSPHRDRAIALSEKWNLSFRNRDTEADQAEIKTFLDAKSNVADLVFELVELQREYQSAKDRKKSSLQKSAAEISSATTEFETAQQLLNEKSLATLAACEQALSLADESTELSEINSIHYYRSLTFFLQGRMVESAVLAEFLLRRFPNDTWTQKAARYLVSSQQMSLVAADEQDKPYYRNKLETTCEEICRRFAGTPESASAAAIMAEIAIRNQQTETAQKFLDQISPTSTAYQRVSAQLGQLKWRLLKTNTTLTDQQKQQQLDETYQLLATAVAPTDQTINYRTASAALTLAKVLIDQDKIEAAIERLESSRVAPLDLIELKHASVSDPRVSSRFRIRAYTTALDAYVAAIGKGTDIQTNIQKATGVISALRAEYQRSKKAEAQKRMTGIYQSVGQKLTTQFEMIDTPSDRTTFAQAISEFFAAIERDSSDSQTVLWAGSVLLKIAGGVEPDDAKSLSQQAVSALDQAEKLGVTDPKSKTALRHQRALAFRGAGEFQKAVDIFITLLKDNPTALNLQIDAAETLTIWGIKTQKLQPLTQAVQGTGSYKKGKRKTNAIFGWRQLEKLTRRNPKFAKSHRESSYQLLAAKYEHGLISKNKKTFTTTLKQLKQMLTRYDHFSAEPWGKKFKALQTKLESKL